MWLFSDGFTESLARKPPALPGRPSMPRVELETPYGPGATELVSDEVFAGEILGQFAAGWELVRQSNPDFFTGITVRGSLIKGRARPESDVDVFLFFNRDLLEDTLQTHGISSGCELSDTEKLLKHTFQAPIKSHMRDAGLSEAQYNFEAGCYDYSTSKLPIQLTNWTKLASGTPSYNLPPGTFVELFHPQLGTGDLAIYRTTIIETLLRLDRERSDGLGTTMWAELMKRLEHNEEHNRGASIYLPALEDALDYQEICQLALAKTGLENSGL